MSDSLVVSLLESSEKGTRFAHLLDAEVVEMELRSFPDQEVYIRIDTPVNDRNVIILADFSLPNDKFLPTLFVAETLRDLKVRSLGLVAPYLPYMRQDARFRPGEGLTSHFFARQISRTFDWLVTVDPHLHRINALDEIYSIPTSVVPAARAIARWIDLHVENPILVGPDGESAQWVKAAARASGLPEFILTKNRTGDYAVEVTGNPAPTWSNQRPVLIDDIISTGRTMVEAARVLQGYRLRDPICIGVHGLFVGDAREVLASAGFTKIITTNTIDDPTNEIDIMEDLAAGTQQLMRSVFD